MTLYTEKSKNIRKTWFLMLLFFGIVIGIGYVFSQAYGDSTILYIAVILSIIMNVASYWFSDSIVLSLHRARPVEMKDNPELYRVVENLSITAGLPMPRVFVIDDLAPNAFATGRDPKHAVVCVTTGILNILDRTELEGVLAHELSHIGNRDMLVSTVAVVLVGFISILADIFMRSMWWGRNRDNDRGSNGIFIIIGIVLSILAPLAATLIQLAISRKRELLADSSGALLTRYPEGLASALIKIGKYSRPMQTASTATAHLFLEDPFAKEKMKALGEQEEVRIPWYAKLFSTHPPIADRVKILRDLKI